MALASFAGPSSSPGFTFGLNAPKLRSCCQSRLRTIQTPYPHGKSLQAVCRRVLRNPQWLPPAMANLGVAMELGADLTRHWWNPDMPPQQEGTQDVDAGAWPACLYPHLAALLPHPAATARQTYDFALGPATALPSLVGPKGTGKVTWQPNVFTDGAMSQIARWAP